MKLLVYVGNPDCWFSHAKAHILFIQMYTGIKDERKRKKKVLTNTHGDCILACVLRCEKSIEPRHEKTNHVVSHKIRHKPSCKVTEES